MGQPLEELWRLTLDTRKDILSSEVKGRGVMALKVAMFVWGHKGGKVRIHLWLTSNCSVKGSQNGTGN